MWPEMQMFFVLVISVYSRSTIVGEAKAAADDGQIYLPASDKEKEFLAQSICSDLELYLGPEEAVRKCMEDFRWNMDPHESGLQIRCRSNTSITYEVPHIDLYQLVLLIPESNYDDPYSLIYNIVQPKSNYNKIDITQDIAYKIFSTVLDKRGRPLVWHREPTVHTWAAPATRDYDVQVKFQNNSNLIEGVLTWNQTGELDACFELDVICDRSREKVITEIWPDSPPSVRIESVPLKDLCYVKLTGMYGTTRYKFHTPAPNVTEKPTFNYPQNISMDAEMDGDTWTVRVVWSQPGLAPDSYNLTLRADLNYTVVLNGSAREAIFKGVTGKDFYNVSMCAILGQKKRHTSRRAIFPMAPVSSSVWQWAGAAGGAWGAVCAGAVASALCWVRFRRRSGPPEKIQSFDPKPAEDDCLESQVESWPTDGWEIKLEKLMLHEVIGEGAFGVVRRGTLAPKGKAVAVKMLKDFPSLEEMRSFRLEMELMKSVGAHPHVVSLLGCYSGRRPLIVAEYCSRGDLLSFLRSSWDVMISKRNAKYYNNNIEPTDYRNDLFKSKLPQEQSRLVVNKMYDLQGLCDTELSSRDLLSFCRQIAMGMEFLSSNRLVHRDLAARNILVTGDRTLKIADFGLSRDVYEENLYKQKGNGKMPIKWMALESLTRRIYTTQSDVWSFGVVLWEVVTVGGAPYPDVPAARLPRILRAGYRMPRPTNCSKQLYDVMQACWRASPRERPTFSELHAQLDDLLNSACADDYLSLELDDEPPPTPRAHRYLKMIMRAKRSWTWGESYERPLKAPHIRYTSPPVILNKTPV